MCKLSIAGLGLLSLLIGAGQARGQSFPAPSVTRLMSVTGVFQPANGQPPAAGTVVTLSIYADREGGAPLWQELQTVTVDNGGRFSLLLGSTLPDGLPLE